MIKVVVLVQGGMVQGALASEDIEFEVIDLDVSDFPEEGEEEAAQTGQERWDELAKTMKMVF